MTRAEMIAALHTLTFAYVDNLLDATFTERPLWINAKGYGYLSCDDPSDQCWEGDGLDPEKWRSIRQKLTDGTLQLEDLEESSLRELLNVMYSDAFPECEDPCEYLQELLTLPGDDLDHIYCMNTIDGWRFFVCEEDFKRAYERDWCDVVWEDLSDDILAECIEQLTDEGLLCGEYIVSCSADDLNIDFQEYIESLDTSYLAKSVDSSEFDAYFEEISEQLNEFLFDEQVDAFYDRLDTVYPEGKRNGNLSYYEAYEHFVNEAKANIQKKYGDFNVQLVAKDVCGSMRGCYSIPVADVFVEVLENNTECGEFDAVIGKYIESSLIKFVKSSSWHLGYQNLDGSTSEITNIVECTAVVEKSCPILWFGPNGEEPIDKWSITVGKEHGFVWVDQWCLLEYLIEDCNDCFSTWYLAECGYFLPDMEAILTECPVEISEADTVESINLKFYNYFNRID